MGCGCLGPTKQKEEVYVHLINLVHEEAPKISSSSNLDLYHIIKEKISKKGHLRKLMDNLASHRSRIPDAMTRNYKSVQTSRELANSYAGIIIADFIIDGIYKKQKKHGDDEENLSHASSNTGKLSNDSKISLHKKNKVKKSEPLSEPLTSEIDTRFDLSYFNLVDFLIINEKRMYHRILDSLSNFCMKRDEKFLCEGPVWKILKAILQEIKTESLLLEGSKSFYLLLNKTKQHIYDEFRNPEILYTIIVLWLKERQITVEQDEIRSNLEQILITYFNRSISCWESEFIYEIVFKIFDQLHFCEGKIDRFQNQIQSIVTTHDLSQHFFRGMFMFLLNYLSFSDDTKIHEKWAVNQLDFKQVRVKGSFANILEQKVKINGFRLITIWIKKKYVSINQIILYNYKTLLYAFVINIHIFNSVKKVYSYFIDEFLKVMKFTNEQSRQVFISRILEELQEENRESKDQEILLKLLKELIGIDKHVQPEIGNFFLQIKPRFAPEIKLEMIMLIGFILEHYNSNQNFQIQFKYEICEFLYCLYKNITTPEEDFLFKYQFVCTVISFIKISLQTNKFEKGVIVAFIQTLDGILNGNRKFPTDTQYCLLYLAFELRYLLFKGLKVPNTIVRINYKISSSMDKQNLKKQAQQYLSSADEIEMEKIKQTTPFNQHIFKEYFKILRQKIFEKEESEMGSRIRGSKKTSQFQRKESLMSEKDEEISDYALDKSFGEILDMINN